MSASGGASAEDTNAANLGTPAEPGQAGADSDDNVRWVLRNGAIDLGHDGYDSESGFGVAQGDLDAPAT